jgi:hypothetical protein
MIKIYYGFSRHINLHMFPRRNDYVAADNGSKGILQLSLEKIMSSLDLKVNIVLDFF